MTRLLSSTACVLALLPTLACEVGIDVAPVQERLKAASTLALGGTAAMTAIAGEGPSCVSMTPACAGAPCAARVEVTVNDECPLPLGQGDGTIVLDGEWSDADTATFTPDLTDLRIGVDGGDVSLGLGVIVLTRDGDEVSVTFGEQGVDVTEEDAVDVEQAGFTVEVSLAGTPADPTDDTLDITGGNQAVSGADVTQLALAGVITDPACRANPVDGTVTILGAGEDEVLSTSLQFHEACDGEADVIASTENPTLIGSTVPLELADAGE
jgi:hypothetical protein